MFGLLFTKKHYYEDMKKLSLLLLIILLTYPSCKADEADDLWTNYGIELKNYPQKESQYVSDEEFDKAIDQMNSKVNKWKTRLQKRNIPKGEEFSQSNETEIIKNNQGEDASLPVLTLPVELSVNNALIPVGHYQIKGEFEDSKPYLNFYQANDLILKLPATETQEDFGKDEILFADWIEENDNKLKIIYGSLDFNAYVIVDIAE